MAIDKMNWHYEGDYPQNIPKENAGTHIGMYLAWIIKNSLISEEYIKNSYDELEQIKKEIVTGRDILLRVCNEKLWENDLCDEGIEFTKFYYDKYFFDDYCSALDDDNFKSIYEIENTWKNYYKIASIIDKRYYEWKEYQKMREWKKADYIFDRDQLNKFWKIEIDDKKLIICYGKAGTKGTSKIKSFASKYECKKEAKKFITKKIKEGYYKKVSNYIDELKIDFDLEFNLQIEQAKRDNSNALFDFGKRYYDLEEYHKAVYWFTKAADLNHLDALCKLGYMYACGNGVKQDLEKAAYLYEKSGTMEAHYKLGYLLIPRSNQDYQFENQGFDKAAYWFLKSAEQGYVYAQKIIGKYYLDGHGIKKDEKLARYWLEKAANHGNEEAKEILKKFI